MQHKRTMHFNLIKLKEKPFIAPLFIMIRLLLLCIHCLFFPPLAAHNLAFILCHLQPSCVMFHASSSHSSDFFLLSLHRHFCRQKLTCPVQPIFLPVCSSPEQPHIRGIASLDLLCLFALSAAVCTPARPMA